jgi:hypothetical protein
MLLNLKLWSGLEYNMKMNLEPVKDAGRDSGADSLIQKAKLIATKVR